MIEALLIPLFLHVDLRLALFGKVLIDFINALFHLGLSLVLFLKQGLFVLLYDIESIFDCLLFHILILILRLILSSSTFPRHILNLLLSLLPSLSLLDLGSN